MELKLGSINFIPRAIRSFIGVIVGLGGVGLHLRLLTTIDGRQAGKSNAGTERSMAARDDER